MKRSKKRTGTYVWTKDEEEYLIKNYQTTPNSELMKVLNKSRHSISAKAFQMGLTKNDNVIEYGGKKTAAEYKEETPLTEDIVYFYHRRDMEIDKIAKDMNRPVEQIRDILNRCINNGMYEYYAEHENDGIKFDNNSALFVRVGDSGNNERVERRVLNAKCKMQNAKLYTPGNIAY